MRRRCNEGPGAPARRDRLRAMLADLKMPGALEAVDGILSEADGGTISAAEAIEQLLNAQIVLRNNRRLQTATRSSRLPAVKTLDQFDFAFQRSHHRSARGRRPGAVALDLHVDGARFPNRWNDGAVVRDIDGFAERFVVRRQDDGGAAFEGGPEDPFAGRGRRHGRTRDPGRRL